MTLLIKSLGMGRESGSASREATSSSARTKPNKSKPPCQEQSRNIRKPLLNQGVNSCRGRPVSHVLFVSIINLKYILQQREMYSTFPSWRPPSPLPNPPVVLFRAVSQSSGYNGPLRGDLDLVSRDPGRRITRQAFDDCLSWEHVETPFIPFFRSWKKVLKRRQWLMEKGREDVMIIAMWSRGLRNVYDAYEVAKRLGYHSQSSDPRKRLENHLDEYLVTGGISAEDYRILAIFHGRTLADVLFSVPRFTGHAIVPDGFLADGIGTRVEEKLENEIYQHTGIRGQSEQLLYLIGSMTGAFDCPWTSFVVMPEHWDWHEYGPQGHKRSKASGR